MAEAGEHERLRELRMFFQYQHQEDFVGAVEAITGRRVKAFISGIDTRRDVSCEFFYLEPGSAEADGYPSRMAGPVRWASRQAAWDRRLC
jgi:hypothetical protein